jgi:hypothetical protein
MNRDDPNCAWVHAHLHRVEGDLGNARFWYRQAGRSPAVGDLAAESAAPDITKYSSGGQSDKRKIRIC